MASNNPESEQERWKRGHKATTEREKAAMPARVQHCMPVRVNSTMIASAGRDRTFAYNDSDWRKMKASLAPVDIDADTVTVGDQWWAQGDPEKELITAAPQRPLREQLQEMAADYRGLWFWHKKGRFLTPKQEAAEIRKALDALEVAYDKMSRVGFISYEGGDARDAITAIIANTKRRLKTFNAEVSSGSTDAR